MFRPQDILSIALVVAAATLLSACASGPDPDSFGGRLQVAGGEVAVIGKQWSEGEEQILEGRKLIEVGQDDIEDGEDLAGDGRAKVRRGEDLVAEGERQKRQAEEAYRLRQMTPTPAPRA